ncbi:hypothetical protein SAY87_013844 [Trapa incisa]|uniref:non-specific serine/threonine protein kinase n=1 Tax=Trapa incisa TaxID=236973 RepID=A0AAN7KI03_9MYRT|nr:hypothetical protein SAY87_013844 [Trapa incisa]
MGICGYSSNSYHAKQSQNPGRGNNFSNCSGHVYHGGGVPDSSLIGGARIAFTYESLMEITNRFSWENIIAQGGFGCVYKGYLPEGRAVAVKQLKMGGGQGDREFRAEVEIISRVHHRHLVSLVGYCISDQQRLLIYEFVPSKTLEHHLHCKGTFSFTFSFHFFHFQGTKCTMGNALSCSFDRYR